MPVSTGQVSAGTAPATLCVMPPGPCTVLVSSAGTVTAYIAAGGTASTANGIPLPSGQSLPPITGYQGPGATLSVVTAGGTATVGFLVSSGPGSTGL